MSGARIGGYFGTSKEYDIVGIGAGPANLALVTAMLDAEEDGAEPFRAVFFERSPESAWHPGTMLPGVKLQVSFLKDLATQRNPRSRFTFLNYLFRQGRIEEFINLREFFPDRDEFAAYLAWVAHEAGSLIRFGNTVCGLRPVPGAGGRFDRVAVRVKGPDGREEECLARALVLATGCTAQIPPGADLVPGHIVHTAELNGAVRSGANPPARVLIVGAGQSAAEAACFALREYPHAQVTVCHRNATLATVDDNPFVNQWYFSERVDTFFAATPDARRHALADLSTSNFGAVERSLLVELNRHHYDGLRHGRPRLSFLACHELRSAEVRDAVVHCALGDLFGNRTAEHRTDLLILATGYRAEPPPCLEQLAPWLLRGKNGYETDRHYRVKTSDTFHVPVFVHGLRQDLYGPAELNLSALALRASVLLDGVRAVSRRAAAA
jgi:L-ornithine N5-monooxygenase